MTPPVVNQLRDPERPQDSSDLLASGGWVQLPRRVRLGVIGVLFTALVGAVTAHFALVSQAAAAETAARAAQKTADEGPARVLAEIAPRLKQLEQDRDAARAERKGVALEVSAVRLYLCRECERTHRRRTACDDICRRGP